VKFKLALLLALAFLAAGDILFYFKAKRAALELAESRRLAATVSQVADGKVREAANAARDAEEKLARARTVERQAEELVRFLALRYFDEWKGSKSGPSYSRHIVSVEQTPGGWHVVIGTVSGNPRVDLEGMVRSRYHLYMKGSGELDRVEKEPGDLVS
jgi:hypothetical protein